MSVSFDLSPQACQELLRSSVVGRAAVCTANGPHIVPLNYSVVDDFVVFRTSPYSVLGTNARNSLLAFEVDQVDPERQQGWSVVVRGRCRSIDETETIAHVEATWSPRPWPAGSRHLYLRLPLAQISGRRLGLDGEPLTDPPVKGVGDGETG